MPQTADATFPSLAAGVKIRRRSKPSWPLRAYSREAVPAVDQFVVGGFYIRLIVGFFPLDHQPRLGQPEQHLGHPAFRRARGTAAPRRGRDAGPALRFRRRSSAASPRAWSGGDHRRAGLVDLVGPVAERAADPSQRHVIIFPERPVVSPPFQVAAVEFAEREGE